MQALAGCGLLASRIDPEFSVVSYEVTGTASDVAITAVVNELGETRVFSSVTLPWSYEYEILTYEMYPPVYLKVEVPVPAPLATGNATSASANQLVDSGASFTGVVQVGDVAVETGTPRECIITAVVAPNTLDLTADIFSGGTEPYAIYPMQTLTGTAYGDGEILETLTLQNYRMGATIIVYNY